MNSNSNSKSLSISLKSFITSLSIIGALVIISYVLTFILPAGEYLREGTSIVTNSDNPYGIFNTVKRDFPFWKFLLSPILALFSDGGSTIIAIIVFLLIIGGIFECLFKQNIIDYLLNKIVNKFYKKRYLLLFVLCFLFMMLASCAGCFEELIPLIPFIVQLSLALGWDTFTGVSIILISSACGYASGLINPFGTIVAQKVAGIALFSGLWFRIIAFIVLYSVLILFLYFHIKKIEKQTNEAEQIANSFVKNLQMEKAIKFLGLFISIGIVFVICSTFITVLQDYTLFVFAFCYLLAGVSASLTSGLKGKEFFKTFLKGMTSLIPAILLILLASSMKYILVESSTLDTLLKYLIDFSKNIPSWLDILFIYFIVLLMELFVPSGTAKAFLLMPLIIPIANVFNISGNLVVLAYIFGDGLANVFYPTNAGLLIGLNIAKSNYASYMKTGWKIALLLLLATSSLLIVGLFIGYC